VPVGQSQVRAFQRARPLHGHTFGIGQRFERSPNDRREHRARQCACWLER
jgi:hypothetical protein